MKNLKTTVVLVMVLFCSVLFSTAQNDNFQAYSIHEDQVKPSMRGEYEILAKEFKALCEKHNIVDADWNAASSVEGNYFYISPIDKLGDLDKNELAPLFEKDGEKATSILNRMDKCYDNHGTYVMLLNKELSYTPEATDVQSEDMNYRKWHYIYVNPENKNEMSKKMKAVKDMFASKNSKVYYRVYQNGFGQLDDFFLVSVSAKDEIHHAQRAKENQKLLGEESKAVFDALFSLSSKYVETTGMMRPDLSYSSKK